MKYLEKKCGKEAYEYHLKTCDYFVTFVIFYLFSILSVSCTNDAAFVYNAYYELESNNMASSIADANFKKLNKIITPEMAFRGYLNSLTNDIALADINNNKIDLEIEINLMLGISTTRHLDETVR